MPSDETGKVSFDHIYSQTDPRPFFRTLRPLEYGIPALAAPRFAALIDEYRVARGVPAPKLLDLGCSYGINAALLRCDITLDELYDRYSRWEGSRAELLTADRDLVRSRARPERAWYAGLDASAAALDYAVAAGYLDEAIRADLEAGEPEPAQRDQIDGTDLVLSTGCIGYVTEKTLLRIVDAAGTRLPWMAHFCLRMFPYDAISGHLDDLGYETVTVGEPVRQRKFATRAEQSSVLDRLSELGIDPTGWESDGWFYAQLHISRPRSSL
ncbi:class I SAM-dependent methyltransferase [Cryptosporangium sp. NPDC048952]|uniref:class I SAM-dependent methyltransferase n=1 Tax=Cryptosporangium sp. NPDC048952 TaxID=3363961 RepID=UPI0037110770